jgi:hypothetical protein
MGFASNSGDQIFHSPTWEDEELLAQESQRKEEMCDEGTPRITNLSLKAGITN